MFFIYNINTLCFRTIDNEKRKNIYLPVGGINSLKNVRK